MDEAEPRAPGALASLGLDPAAVLVKDSGLLLDPQFLGALHSELDREFGAAEASATLLQIGFLHGLQDATRAVQGAFGAGRAAPAVASAPALAIRFATAPCPGVPGALEICGSWPERQEAGARLAALGVPAHAACAVSAGYTSGWLSGILEADLLAIETACSARGEDACRFVAREAQVWRDGGDPRAAATLEDVPFATLRQLVRVETEVSGVPRGAGVDPDAAVVHVWGPVMVIPFGGADEAIQAVEMIGHDPAARNVSVVVVDLSGAVLDEAFGAVALEQILDTVEAWGADAILAEVSPLSQAVVDGLARQPLMVHKDLDQAIASGFQIAQAQRRSV